MRKFRWNSEETKNIPRGNNGARHPLIPLKKQLNLLRRPKVTKLAEKSMGTWIQKPSPTQDMVFLKFDLKKICKTVEIFVLRSSSQLWTTEFYRLIILRISVFVNVFLSAYRVYQKKHATISRPENPPDFTLLRLHQGSKASPALCSVQAAIPAFKITWFLYQKHVMPDTRWKRDVVEGLNHTTGLKRVAMLMRWFLYDPGVFQ